MEKDLTQKRIGLRIKARRIELNLTQEELAARLGNKSRASVCTVENGKEDLTTTRIKQYAAALECDPSYLMGWADAPIDYDTKQDISEEKRRMENYGEIIAAYNAASPDTQAAVRAILHMGDK